jgi:hypothetical protein
MPAPSEPQKVGYHRVETFNIQTTMQTFHTSRMSEWEIKEVMTRQAVRQLADALLERAAIYNPPIHKITKPGEAVDGMMSYEQRMANEQEVEVHRWTVSVIWPTEDGKNYFADQIAEAEKKGRIAGLREASYKAKVAAINYRATGAGLIAFNVDALGNDFAELALRIELGRPENPHVL